MTIERSKFQQFCGWVFKNFCGFETVAHEEEEEEEEEEEDNNGKRLWRFVDFVVSMEKQSYGFRMGKKKTMKQLVAGKKLSLCYMRGAFFLKKNKGLYAAVHKKTTVFEPFYAAVFYEPQHLALYFFLLHFSIYFMLRLTQTATYVTQHLTFFPLV